MREYIFSLEISMYNFVSVQLLSQHKDTAMPLMSCFRIKIASASGILPLLDVYSCRSPPLQYYMTIIFNDLFS